VQSKARREAGLGVRPTLVVIGGYDISRFKVSESQISAGNSWAIGSIVAAVAASPAIVVGDYGRRNDIDMNEDLATGLLVGGVIVGVAGLVMCVVSDGEYVATGNAYNEHLAKPAPGDGDDGAPVP
jgi:hypothetical protein